MKTIIAFAASNSKNSINKQLATYAAHLVENAIVTVLDLNDFELPIYGIDYENEHGVPKNAHMFLNYIKSADGIVISLAEHNGAYAAVFKNIYDWMSRIDKSVWQNKPMLLMATSPGGRGGASVLEFASNSFPRMGANLKGTFSLPSFGTNFSDGKIIDKELEAILHSKVEDFKNSL